MQSRCAGPDITLLITAYNQDLKACLNAIASAALQRDCAVQIIIADDCSRIDHSDTFRSFLVHLGHRDFCIVRHPQNLKTVRNILEALPHANAPYIKCMGAGDLLYGNHTLAQIVETLETTNAPGGFGNIISFSDGNSTGGTRFAAPRSASDYRIGAQEDNANLFINQMMSADWIPGCSQFFVTEHLGRLLNELTQVYDVRYCEDFAMTLMLYNATPVYLDEPILWYNFGDGISTSGNIESVRRLYRDHSSFYRVAAQRNPFKTHLVTARAAFLLRRFIALDTPIYRMLQRAVARNYASDRSPYPYNEFFQTCHERVDRFLALHEDK